MQMYEVQRERRQLTTHKKVMLQAYIVVGKIWRSKHGEGTVYPIIKLHHLYHPHQFQA